MGQLLQSERNLKRSKDLGENRTVPQPVPDDCLVGHLQPGDILTPGELAERLKVPKSWIFEQTRHRAKVRNKTPLPCLRLGKYLRFSWLQVSEWLYQNNR
jgi:hypothetical protein